MITTEIKVCAIEGCGRIRKQRSSYCTLHAHRMTRHGDPTYVKPGTRGNWGCCPSYEGAHMRVRKVRGKASAYPCVKCGGHAQEWAYQHDDPDERTGIRADRWMSPYSVNPDHYAPMCCHCHRLYDAEHAR